MKISVSEIAISVPEMEISVLEAAAALTLSSYTRKRVDLGVFLAVKAVFSDN